MPDYWASPSLALGDSSFASLQLLREGPKWRDPLGRISSRRTLRFGPLEEHAAATVECGDGTHAVHRLDLRLSETALRSAESGASLDAARHRSGQAKKRLHRR